MYSGLIVLKLNSAISNYTIHRRDRNWFDNDKREKGGIAIYVRKNVKVKSVSRSELFESIRLEIVVFIIHDQDLNTRKTT